MSPARAAPPDRSQRVPAAAPRGADPGTRQPGRGSGARRFAGAILALLVLLPVYRLLDTPTTGLAGAATVGATDDFRDFLQAGTLMLVGLGLAAGVLLPPGLLPGGVRRLGAALERVPATIFAWAVAALAAVSCLVEARLLGGPALVDAMAELWQARFLAAGHLAGPGGPDAAFWMLQNSLVTPAGWVSQYPPGHLLLLAAGLRLGAVALVPAVLAAVATGFGFLAAERLLPGDRAAVRLGALLLAVLPFQTALAATYMNHVTLAAAASLSAYAVIRARQAWPWAIVFGAAASLMAVTRPLSGVAIAVVLVGMLWLRGRPLAGRALVGRLCLTLAAALPGLVLLALYNHHVFGAVWRFGYDAALGPATRLGFHPDPWGNTYGPRQALGYASAELTALGLFLLETPIPATLLVGVYLAAARKLDDGIAVLAAWALAPFVANLLYWHHGLFMGPRMLADVAPPWAILSVVVAVRLARALPERLPGARLSPRTALSAMLLLAGAGSLVLGPLRLRGYTAADAGVVPPVVSGPALVFVHGGWTSRIAMSLMAAGMRGDSVETALRQNGTCRVQTYAAARLAGIRLLPVLDMRPRADALPPRLQIVPGDRIRVERGEVLTDECRREVRADTRGIVDVSPMLWRGDLPLPGGKGTLLVRDLGPARNAMLLRRFPARRAYVLATAFPDAPPRLHSYAEGMMRLWGDSAGDRP